MASAPRSDRRGDYGIDAPYVPVAFAVAALAALAWGAYNTSRGAGLQSLPLFATSAWFVLAAASYLYTTRVGKFRVWSELLAQASLRGDERVLDVGCGRGAVLLLAAECVPQGGVVGVDLWSRADQSGNDEATTRRNAELEGVAGRVELLTGDMRSLPLGDASVDLVVSSLAIHNVPDAAGRAQAIDEIWRVLKPGGRVLLADFRSAGEYEARLRERGAREVQTRGLGWRFWYGGPFSATRLVSARKAPASDG